MGKVGARKGGGLSRELETVMAKEGERIEMKGTRVGAGLCQGLLRVVHELSWVWGE